MFYLQVDDGFVEDKSSGTYEDLQIIAERQRQDMADFLETRPCDVSPSSFFSASFNSYSYLDHLPVLLSVTVAKPVTHLPRNMENMGLTPGTETRWLG